MIKSFKIRLELNNVQTTLALKHAGVARHAWNWGLNEMNQQLERNKNVDKDKKEKFYSAIDLHKKLVREVKTVCPWYYEVSKSAPQAALGFLSEAFKKCFIHKINKYPKFKKKGCRDSFCLEDIRGFQINKNKIRLPVFGWIKCSEIINELICGNVKKELKLSERTYNCEVCNHSQDRDLNAAINIKNFTAGSTVNACGVLQQSKAVSQGNTVKQEKNINWKII